MPVVVRDGRDGVAVRWESWQTWRGGRLLPEHVVLRDVLPPPVPVTASWCVTCTGQRYIVTVVCGEQVRAACPTCRGTGATRG